MVAALAQLLQRPDLQLLLDELHAQGYRVLGPRVREGAVAYAPLRRVEELPIGLVDVEQPGSYRLEEEGDRWFGTTPGPVSPRAFLQPARQVLWEAEPTPDGFALRKAETETPRYAFLGLRACELAALKIQDRVFTGGAYADPHYRARREELFLVAVQCTRAGGTCFCASMGTGPQVREGFDLALTELDDQFLVEVGSERGGRLLEALPTRPAGQDDVQSARERVAETARSMGRTMETEGLPELLLGNLEHPRWDDVAGRCLACANCTFVCPTCFCFTVADPGDLQGVSRRERRWDSCFDRDFSYAAGHPVRGSTRSRYRQWLTHKLATWHHQFGSSGCVGCGRCITWCPVGIDLTAEVAALRHSKEAL